MVEAESDGEEAAGTDDEQQPPPVQRAPRAMPLPRRSQGNQRGRGLGGTRATTQGALFCSSKLRATRIIQTQVMMYHPLRPTQSQPSQRIRQHQHLPRRLKPRVPELASALEAPNCFHRWRTRAEGAAV